MRRTEIRAILVCSGVGRTIVKRTVRQSVELPANNFGVLGRTEEAFVFG